VESCAADWDNLHHVPTLTFYDPNNLANTDDVPVTQKNWGKYLAQYDGWLFQNHEGKWYMACDRSKYYYDADYYGDANGETYKNGSLTSWIENAYPVEML
jgi:hypothetical protein